MHDLDLSVVIGTRDRAESLMRTLGSFAAVENRTGLRWEVVVVDNGSVDQTATRALSFMDRLPLRVMQEPAPGISRARNAGIREARGHIILLTDDDCLVAPDWLENGAKLLRVNPHQLIGGRVDLHNEDDVPLSVKTTDEREILDTDISLWGFVHGANFALTQDVFATVGLFDEALGPGTNTKAAEDTDFVYRCLRAGIPVVYEPGLCVSHDHRRKGHAAYSSLQRSYSKGMGAFAVKHLLRGDRRPMKELYWDFRSTALSWRSGQSDIDLVLAKTNALAGIAYYCLGLLRSRQ